MAPEATVAKAAEVERADTGAISLESYLLWLQARDLDDPRDRGRHDDEDQEAGVRGSALGCTVSRADYAHWNEEADRIWRAPLAGYGCTYLVPGQPVSGPETT
jgi:hypothetical protein